MNCRPRDIAMVVNCGCAATCNCCGQRVTTVRPGTVVRVLELLSNGEWTLEDRIWVDRAFDCGLPLRGSVVSIADDVLRPLRDSDGQDEILRIAGLPQPVEA